MFDIPPPEIIEALEAELDATFVHFVVSMEGVVEGIFESNTGDSTKPEVLTVGFEAKREFLNVDAQLESVMAEMDDNTLKAVRDMLESTIGDLDARLDGVVKMVEPNTDFTPEFDGDWFSP